MREEPEYEDMGRRARRYTMTAVILGEDYDRARQALVEVLEAEGPHLFSHPWWEERLVIVEDAGEFEESNDRGGICKVNLTLTEAGGPTRITATVVPEAIMSAAIEAAGDAAVADFEKNFAVGLADSFGAAQVALGTASDKIDSVNNKIAAALGIADGVVAALDELKDQATTLLGAPGALGATLRDLLAAATNLLGLTSGVGEQYPGQATKIAGDTALAAALELGAIDVTAQPPFPGGPLHPQTKAATRAIGKAVRTMSLIGVANVFRTLPLESTSAATKVLTTLGGLTQRLLADDATSDALAAALTDLRAAMQQHLDVVAGNLPSITTYTPTASVPALLLAWQLHGDPTRDLEIVARNDVLDPNFVPGGEPLEILGA